MRVRFGECISPIRYLIGSKEMEVCLHAGVLRRSMSAGDCEDAWGPERAPYKMANPATTHRHTSTTLEEKLIG
jgi:hypothetical protein